jgi:hypothetical protein
MSSKTKFINYLKGSLIPDFTESGMICTADDFRTAANLLQGVAIGDIVGSGVQGKVKAISAVNDTEGIVLAVDTNPESAMPYITWAINLQDHSVYWGNYFNNADEAMISFTKRAFNYNVESRYNEYKESQNG